MYTHTTDTEYIPMGNCGDGKLYVGMEGGKVRKCMTQEEYDTYSDNCALNTAIAFGIAVVITAVLFGIIYILANRDGK